MRWHAFPNPAKHAAISPPAGRGVARPLSARDREIAARARPVLCTREGLLLVGLDVIGDYLTEINVTSPTCFQEISDQTGFNVAGMMVDALEKIRSREPHASAQVRPHSLTHAFLVTTWPRAVRRAQALRSATA